MQRLTMIGPLYLRYTFVKIKQSNQWSASRNIQHSVCCSKQPDLEAQVLEVGLLLLQGRLRDGQPHIIIRTAND